MELLDRQSTSLGGASNYGAGAYGVGVYSGGATNYVEFSPRPFGVVWEPSIINCNTDSQSFTTFAVYLDIATPENCIGTSYNGNQDTVYLPAVQITANTRLICVWFGGDAGSNASAMLIGDMGELTR